MRVPHETKLSTDERHQQLCQTLLRCIVDKLRRMDFQKLQKAYQAVSDILSGRV